MYSRSISTDAVFPAASPYGLNPIPCLDPDCRPPEIIGTCAMATAMMHGASTPALAEMIGHLDHNPSATLFDTMTALYLAFCPEQAAELQQLALAGTQLYRVRSDNPDAIRLLAICAPGDLMANTPLDFITSHLDVRLDLLFVVPGQDLPKVISDHDLAFFAANETDPAALARLCGLFAAWPRPVLNNPALLPQLARERLPALLSDLPTICSPAAALASRAALAAVAGGQASMADLLQGVDFPVLVRPKCSHAGVGLERIETAGAILEYLAGFEHDEFHVSQFHDYRSRDGLYRKYRVGFIDGRPYFCHMAASRHWMVHYLNAGMTESAAKRADEAAAMACFDNDFAIRHGAAFAALSRRLGFDFFSIDCGEMPDGRLVLFEADTAAIVHMMDPIETFPYKHVHMRRVFAAFDAMLRRRCFWPNTGLVAPAALHPGHPFPASLS